jgi:WhiB family transcriptional regulator, redox-sensing transcriptional regulator
MVFLRQLNSPPAVSGVDFDPTLDRRGKLDWTQWAACRGQTSLFFPTHAERPAARELREAHARALCLACPVLEQCRARARQHHEYGFWGGETEEERAAAGYPVALPVGQVARRIRILRQVALASAPAGYTSSARSRQ